MTIKQNLALEDIELVIQYLITGFPLIFSLQGVMDTSLGRIHVELYKEIKKVKEDFSAVFRGKTEQIFHVSCIPCGF